MEKTASAHKSFNLLNFISRAADYEKLTGGCTRSIAKYMLSSTTPPLSPTSIVLDNACGTGVLTSEILKLIHGHVHAVDLSPAMIDLLKHILASSISDGTVSAAVMDGQHLDFPDNMFTHSYTNFGVFLFPDGLAGLRELHRTLQPGGKTYISTWHKVGYMPILHGVQHAIRPSEAPFKLPFGEEWQDPEFLRGMMESAGFVDVEVRIERTTSVQEDVETLVDVQSKMFLAMAPFVSWDEEEKQRFVDEFVAYVKKSKDIIWDENRRPGIEMVANVACGTKKRE